MGNFFPYEVFLYHILLRRFRKKDYRQSRIQYIFYFVMLEYGLGSSITVAVMASRDTDYFLLCINPGCIVFVNMYLFYFMKMSDEKNEPEFRLAMMKQQEEMQFDYYRRQQEQCRQSIAILHDVSRHIRSIEKLYRAGEGEQGRIGILNVEKCAEKYGGSVFYRQENGKLYSDVLLNR